MINVDKISRKVELVHTFYRLFQLKTIRRRFQRYINDLFLDERKLIIGDNQFDFIEVGGLKYGFNRSCVDLKRPDNPIFKGIRQDDVVLDIGANIGDFAIPASRLCKSVIAFEPVLYSELLSNIEYNNVHNIETHQEALGKTQNTQTIYYGNDSATVPTVSFNSMLNLSEKIDMVSCDCEGAEWTIEPDECRGIRELRFEFHIRSDHRKDDRKSFKKWLKLFEGNNYRTNIRLEAVTRAIFSNNGNSARVKSSERTS